MNNTIGLDIGGTKISACLVNAENKAISSGVTETPKEGKDQVIRKAINLINEIAGKSEDNKFIGIGISTGGDVNHITGEVLSATRLIPDWKGAKLGYIFREEFHCPVFVENDGSMAAYGEWKIGEGIGSEHVVCLTIGTGLGGGIISGSKLLHGLNGSIANFCFLDDPYFSAENSYEIKRNLEYYLSGPGLLRIAKILDPENTYESPESIIEAFTGGDGFAEDVMGIFFKYLKYCLNIIKCVLSPEIVVIGGGVITNNYDIMHKEFINLQKEFPFKVVPSGLKNKAGMIGAAIYAREILKIK